MIDFLLKHYYIYLTHAVELLAAITGIFCYKKYKNTYVKYFIYFLIIVVFADFLGYYTKYVDYDRALAFLIGTKFEKNHWWYNLYWSIGVILFFAFYYHRILKTVIFKTIIKVTGYCFLLFSLCFVIIKWNEFFYKNFIALDTVGAVVIFLCTFLYFIEILNSEELLNFYRSMNFYISGTIFIWWLIITPLTLYDVYFAYEIGKGYFDENFLFLRRLVYLIANVFMYLIFAFALVTCKPNKNEALC